jgi:hypothetical protein
MLRKPAAPPLILSDQLLTAIVVVLVVVLLVVVLVVLLVLVVVVVVLVVLVVVVLVVLVEVVEVVVVVVYMGNFHLLTIGVMLPATNLALEIICCISKGGQYKV